LPIGKRVRKRRRKKKRAESPEKLNGQHPRTVPDTIIEHTRELTQITECPKIQIISANSDSRVEEFEWIKQNEALLIADLKTRQQAGLPIQVVVRVEKITPSVPEYCQIIPDFCHLDVIKEETSASDEDPKKENWECSEKNRNTNNFKKLLEDCGSNVEEEKHHELEIISEVNTSEIITSECQIERLESPSLVRDSEILRFADIVITENECLSDLETLEPLKRLLDVYNIDNNKCIDREARSIPNKNNLNSGKHKDHFTTEYIKVNKSPIQHEKIINNSKIVNGNRKKNQFITNTLLDIESYEDLYFQKHPIEINCKDKKIKNLDILNTKTQLRNSSASAELSSESIMKKNNQFSKNVFNNHQEDTEHDVESSDDSTIKQCKTYDLKQKSSRQNKVSIHDKLKQI